jgi:hypothetical protein
MQFVPTCSRSENYGCVPLILMAASIIGEPVEVLMQSVEHFSLGWIGR